MALSKDVFHLLLNGGSPLFGKEAPWRQLWAQSESDRPRGGQWSSRIAGRPAVGSFAQSQLPV